MSKKKRETPDHTKTYPFQVRMWYPENKDLQYLGGAHWEEQGRCEFASQAKRIARALAHVVCQTLTVVVDEKGEYIAHFPSLQTFARVMREAEEAAKEREVALHEAEEPPL